MHVLSVSTSAASLKTQIASLPSVRNSLQATQKCGLMARMGRITGAGRNPFKFLKQAALAVTAAGMVLCGMSQTALAATTTTTLAITAGGIPATLVPQGAQVTLTATVVAGATPVTSGTVNFCEGAFCTDIHRIGTAQLTSAGSAVFSFTPGAGSHNYTAAFKGSTGFASSATASASALSVVLLGGPGPSATTSTVAPSGSVGNYTLTATVSGTSLNGLTGTVSFLDTSNADYLVGSGALSPPVLGTGLSVASTIAPSVKLLGDFDGDGKPDLVTLIHDPVALTDSVQVQLGNGDGTFTPTASQLALTQGVAGMALGDFNGDGKLDLAVVGVSATGLPTDPDLLFVLLGNGDGTFTQAAPFALTNSDLSIVAGDLNNDGNLDLAVTNLTNNNVSILIGNGDGTFSLAATQPNTGSGPNGIVVGDINNDGNLDLVTPNSNDPNTYTVLLGNGDGTFTSQTYLVSSAYQVWSVILGDFNGDGKLDLAVTDLGVSGVVAGQTLIQLGVGDGTFAAPVASLTSIQAPEGLALGDFNGDGILDLAIQDGLADPNYPNYPAILELGVGDGTFVDGPAQFVAAGNLMVAGDVNGDGLTDLAVIDTNSQTDLLLTGVTQTATATASGISVVGAAAASHQVAANYVGDINNNPSTSGPTPLTSQPATTSIVLTANPASSVYGQPVTLTATLSPYVVGSYTTNGEAVVFNGVAIPNTGTLSGGVATLTVSSLAAGSVSLSASYPGTGDANFSATASTALLYTVAKAPQTINFPAPASPVVFGVAPITLAATGGGSGNPVTFSVVSGAGSITGNVLTVNGAGTIVIAANQAGDANYNAAAAVQQSIVVNKAVPAITWSTPAPITYGAALSATQLNASAVPAAGTFVYTPASGTVLTAGSQTLSVTFTPTDSVNYSPATKTVTLVVNKAAPTITWATPAAITYGTALSATQLNATATPSAGTFVYTPALGFVPTAGSKTLSVTFTPTDSTNYATATSTVTLVVNKATPTITWTTPAAITYGAALGATQLNASSTTAGTFAYTPASGTVLTVGSKTLSVTFTPTDAANYNTAAATVTLVVNKATPAITWATPAAIPFGTALSATQLNASSTTPGTFVYTPASGTVLAVGPQTLSVTFTPTDAVDYNTATSTVTLVVGKTTPSIAWANPAPISYGSPLTAAQLNATSTTPGTFAYSPALGAVLTAGSQTLSVTFTPTDTASYTTATSTVTLVVNKANPTITWGTPAGITYGTALSATQLNASSTTPGTFAYTPASGTVLAAGSHTLSVTFTPTDATDYTTATSTVTVVVSKAAPAITWGPLAAISYGTPLSAAQLNASTTTAGTYAYTPALGTVLAVGSQTLSVTFTPTDATDYTTATSTVTLLVNQATPTITWGTPAAITYGTALSATQLNASSATAGTFVYTPALGTVLTAGSQLLSVTFTPTDATNYATATSTITLVVNKAAPSITWGAPAAITFGTALSAAQLNATSTTPGTFAYTPALGTVPAAGSQTLSVTFTPTDTTNYSTATSTVTLLVNKGAAIINWVAPAAIPYGTALSATQLNASSTPAAGTFVYSPAAGAVLAVGSQTLSVTFTPTDAADYTSATASVTLQVNQASQTITFTPPITPVIYGASPIALVATGGASNNPVIFSVISGPGTISGNLLTITGVGTVVVAANQAGNSNYTAAAQVTQSIVVSLASQTISFTPPAAVTFGVAPIGLAANGGPSGNPVTFSVISGPGSITGSTLTITGAGTVVVAANQAGNATYSAAATVQQSIVVNKAASGITLTSNVNPVLSQNSITLTATVSSGAGAPTGTVAFVDGATPLGSGTVNASGVATLALTTLSVGSHSITAAYTGDSNFGASTSGVITQVVEDFSLAISGAGGTTVTVTKGSAGVFTFTLSPTAPATTFPAAVTLAASGLPAGATATFSPTSIAAGAGSTTVTLTIQTSATAFNMQPAMPNSAKPVEVAQNGSSKLPFLALALILLPFASRMRRTGKKLGRILPLLLLLVAGIAALGVSGCGGSSSIGGQTNNPVSYTIQITATSGTLSHSTNVTLTVQ